MDPTARCDQLPTLGQSRRNKKKIQLTYSVFTGKVKYANKKKGDSLFNRGANGGVTANNMRPMDEPHISDCFISITCVGNHLIPQKRIGCYCAVSRSTAGDCLCIYAKYVCAPEKSTTILLVIQLEHYKNKVIDRHWLLEGSQLITTTTGNIFPLVFKKVCAVYPNVIP